MGSSRPRCSSPSPSSLLASRCCLEGGRTSGGPVRSSGGSSSWRELPCSSCSRLANPPRVEAQRFGGVPGGTCERCDSASAPSPSSSSARRPVFFACPIVSRTLPRPDVVPHWWRWLFGSDGGDGGRAVEATASTAVFALPGPRGGRWPFDSAPATAAFASSWPSSHAAADGVRSSSHPRPPFFRLVRAVAAATVRSGNGGGGRSFQ